MEKPTDIQTLFRRYLDNQYSKEDLVRILDYFQANEYNPSLRTLIEQELSIPEDEENSEAVERILGKVDIHIERLIQTERGPLPLYRRWYFSTAASICIVLAGMAVYFTYRQNSKEHHQTEVVQNDAAPGGNKATLKLADGSVISLDEAAEGLLANESGVAISKTKDGELLYNNEDSKNSIPTFNEVSTPKGGQYIISLPDGTRVWLNAASTLRYPTRFTDAQRKVTLTGEGYFEVATNKQQPFVVESQGQLVEVLGTHFNINSYTNEKGIKTSLLEGSVKVTEQVNRFSKVLKPAQQSVVSNQSITIAAADVDEVTAWKDGLFRFQNTDIKTLMRQLERWYDIEVDEAALPDKKFNGEMSRDVRLSQVLKMIEVTSNLKFKLEGRRLIMVQ